MKRWYQEDWEFRIEVKAVGKDNKPTNCRMGYEPGDSFTRQYGCPQGFCPKSMLKVFPIVEAMWMNHTQRLMFTKRAISEWSGIDAKAPNLVVTKAPIALAKRTIPSTSSLHQGSAFLLPSSIW